MWVMPETFSELATRTEGKWRDDIYIALEYMIQYQSSVHGI
jgi:hypothetical protein